jgi:hypothetical protein
MGGEADESRLKIGEEWGVAVPFGARWRLKVSRAG